METNEALSGKLARLEHLLSRRHCQLGELAWLWRQGRGRLGWSLVLCQAAAVAVPVTWFQVVNRSVISRRYS
jgi:hypothetical protein